MNRKELFSRIENYDSDLDIKGDKGGDYGHRLADALSRNGYFRLNPPQKGQNFVRSSFPPCIDPLERKMFKEILNWRERVLENQ